MSPRIAIDSGKVADFCRRWKIAELSLFGSVLREDFRPDSDVDVLVTFAPDSEWDLFDLLSMQDELKEIFGREVDLVQKKNLKNPFRRHHILRSHQVVYAA